MNYLELAKKWYPKYTSFEDLKIWVKVNAITSGQFKEVTGQDFPTD